MLSRTASVNPRLAQTRRRRKVAHSRKNHLRRAQQHLGLRRHFASAPSAVSAFITEVKLPAL